MPNWQEQFRGFKDKQAKDSAAWKSRVDNPFRDVDKAMGYAREGVMGYGEMLRPEILKDIGSTLGGLNEIGALRSGAVPTALNDLAGHYGNQVGAYAAQAASGALGYGLDAFRSRSDREESIQRVRSAKASRRGSFARDLGSVIGSGVSVFTSGVGFGRNRSDKIGRNRSDKSGADY